MHPLIKTVTVGILLLNVSFLQAQTDTRGSGQALQFDGVDDQVELGNVYDDLTFPFTVSAWVKLKPGENGGPVFVSQNNLPIYNGFWFFVTPTSIAIEYGDGLGENLPAFRRGKNAQVPNITGRWTHMCAVVRGLSDVLLYVNGIPAGGDITGESLLPMASNYPGDVATIGYFLSNGRHYWFKGEIDNVQMYNKALEVSEIRNSMTKKLSGNESGLIGYWNFDELSSLNANDISANRFNGILKGGVARKISGAPIGDENIFSYSINSGTEVRLNTFAVSNFQNGVPPGIHIYRVQSSPSQTGGLIDIPNDYYGVFIADLSSGKTFVLKDFGSGCSASKRADNSEPTWASFIPTLPVPDRGEFVRITPMALPDVELGPDLVICNAEKATLNSSLPAQYAGSVRWSTGETTPSIIINKTGTYTVKVSDNCTVKGDTVRVTFEVAPPAFSLGEDEVVCSITPRVLQPIKDKVFAFEWQDGSHDSFFLLNDFGTYTLTVRNYCGETSDSITILPLADVRYDIPNVFTPNGDASNQFFVITPLIQGNHLRVFNRWGKTIYETSNYQNDWAGDGISSGRYFFTFKPACGQPIKGSLSILR